MVNNYDVAVLSEKVAYLEAAIKNAGIELPEVTSEDNGKTLQVVNGAWATGVKIPGVIDALDSTSTTDALSAAQGKVLNDKIYDITPRLSGGNITTLEQLNALPLNTTIIGYVAGNVGAFAANDWCTIITSGSSEVVNQIQISKYGIAYRHFESNAWGSWYKVSFT